MLAIVSLVLQDSYVMKQLPPATCANHVLLGPTVSMPQVVLWFALQALSGSVLMSET